LNWILGVNPLIKPLFVLLVQAVTPCEPCIIKSAFFRTSRSQKPLLKVPTTNPSGDKILQTCLMPKCLLAKRYTDIPHSWATIEPVIYGNAAFVSIAAWFIVKYLKSEK
jgi:hypothetical protein